MSTEETNEETTESHDALVERVLRSRYGRMMPKAESRRLIRELASKYYVDGRPVESPSIAPTRGKRETNTKSAATLVALNEQPLPIEKPVESTVPVEPVVATTVEAQQPVAPVITEKPAPVVSVPTGSVKIPKGVAAIIGTTVANLEVISFNETESRVLRGKVQKPFPYVNCHCKLCGSDISMNAYWITGGNKKDCGCTSKRKG